MVTSLFKYERIRTTDAKAKVLKRWADHMITLAKRGDLHARRQALSIIREKKVVHHLFEAAPERYGKVTGGYTRVVKLGQRPGDAAQMSIVELIDFETREKTKPSKRKARKKGTETPSQPTGEPVEEKAEEKKSKTAVETEVDNAGKEDVLATDSEKMEDDDAIDAAKTPEDKEEKTEPES